MDDKHTDVNQCLERFIWDFLELHGFTSGRKADVTLMAALTIFIVGPNKIQMKDIASAFNVSNSTVTDYVDYLENKGYVKRVRNEKDRREVYIELTDKGREWAERRRKLTTEYLEERLSKLTTEERALFISLVTKFLDVEEPPAFLRFPKE